MTNKFESAFSVGQEVYIDFQNSKSIKGGCKVAGVKFTDYGKVLYDISIPLGYEETVILKEVDSILVMADPIEAPSA